MTDSASRWLRRLYAITCLVVIVAALFLARSVLIPVVLAILLTFLLSPLMLALQRLRLGRVPAALLVLISALGVTLLVGSVVAQQLQTLMRDLPQHRKAILAKVDTLKEQSRESWLADLAGTINEIAKRLQEDETAQTQPATPVRVVTDHFAMLHLAAVPLLDLLVMTGLVLVLVFFMLLRREDLRNRLIRLWGHHNLITATKAFDDAGRRIGFFLITQLAVNVAFGVLFGLGLALLGAPYPVLGGFLAGILRYIPYLGVWIAGAGPIALSFAILPGWAHVVLILLVLLVLEVVFAYIVEPIAFGHSIGVSEVSLLIALAFWGWLWGLPGMILATPLTACLAVLGRRLPRLRFLHILLGDEPPLEPPYAFYQRLVARDSDEAIELVNAWLKDHPAEEERGVGAPRNGIETVSEELLLPSLIMARAHRERGELTAADEAAVYQQIRDLPPGLGGLGQPAAERERNGQTNGPFGTEDRVRVLGCPAGEEANAVALEMFARVLPPRRIHLEIAPATLLAGELVLHVREEDPPILLVAALPPGANRHVRQYVKRLRAEFPEKKIVVACWGLTPEQKRKLGRLRDQLLDAGADLVGSSMAETRTQLTALLPLSGVQKAEARS